MVMVVVVVVVVVGVKVFARRRSGVLGGGKIINMGLLDSFMMQLAKKVGPAYRAACGHRAYGTAAASLHPPCILMLECRVKVSGPVGGDTSGCRGHSTPSSPRARAAHSPP